MLDEIEWITTLTLRFAVLGPAALKESIIQEGKPFLCNRISDIANK